MRGRGALFMAATLVVAACSAFGAEIDDDAAPGVLGPDASFADAPTGALVDAGAGVDAPPGDGGNATVVDEAGCTNFTAGAGGWSTIGQARLEDDGFHITLSSTRTVVQSPVLTAPKPIAQTHVTLSWALALSGASAPAAGDQIHVLTQRYGTDHLDTLYAEFGAVRLSIANGGGQTVEDPSVLGAFNPSTAFQQLSDPPFTYDTTWRKNGALAIGTGGKAPMVTPVPLLPTDALQLSYQLEVGGTASPSFGNATIILHRACISLD